jgi:hypothetical protein
MKSLSSFVFSALKKVRQHEHLDNVDLFYPLIVGQKQSGFLLNSRGDLQGIGQAHRVAPPDEAAASASFSSIDATESEEKDLSVNLISSAREKFLSAKGFVRISANVTLEVTARTA